jgi:hypothetical protein
MKIEMKQAITPKAFSGFVVFIIIQFIVYINSKQAALDLILMILNIAFAAILMLLGIDNPSLTKFLKDLGGIMLDFSGSPQLKLSKIQSIWQQLALLWMTTAEEVEKEKEEKIKDLKV